MNKNEKSESKQIEIYFKLKDISNFKIRDNIEKRNIIWEKIL